MSVCPESVQVVGNGQVEVSPDSAVLDLGTEAWGALVADAIGRAGEPARVHGIRYTVSDPTPARQEARSLAVQDARSRAEQLAALVGLPLGRAIDILEREDDGGWQPERMLALDSAAGEPGVQRIGVCVQVRWAFAD